jgi:hypothetical protein
VLCTPLQRVLAKSILFLSCLNMAGETQAFNGAAEHEEKHKT